MTRATVAQCAVLVRASATGLGTRAADTLKTDAGLQ